MNKSLLLTYVLCVFTTCTHGTVAEAEYGVLLRDVNRAEKTDLGVVMFSTDTLQLLQNLTQVSSHFACRELNGAINSSSTISIGIDYMEHIRKVYKDDSQALPNALRGVLEEFAADCNRIDERLKNKTLLTANLRDRNLIINYTTIRTGLKVLMIKPELRNKTLWATEGKLPVAITEALNPDIRSEVLLEWAVWTEGVMPGETISIESACSGRARLSAASVSGVRYKRDFMGVPVNGLRQVMNLLQHIRQAEETSTTQEEMQNHLSHSLIEDGWSNEEQATNLA